MTRQNPETVDEYLENHPPEIRKRLQQIRTIVRKAAPDAAEKISYGMPAFTLSGILLYYAAHTKHVGLYPFTTAIEAFREELKPYKSAKGSIQFQNDQPLPVKLIRQIVEFRVSENRFKAIQKNHAGKKK